MDWYNLKPPSTAWLVYGLITSNDNFAVIGKPKAGKSSFTRNLVVSVIKGIPFLGRAIDTGKEAGRVLYIHLDRKDRPAKVGMDFKRLGCTASEKTRLVMKVAEEIPSSFDERLKWLKKEAKELKPHLIVIDLMWQFVVAKNSNDYNAVLEGINSLQDALTASKYQGALLVTIHGRKASNPEDPMDDILGSTGQRGSFNNIVMLTRYRREGHYTIFSDQTDRDTEHGEIDETIITRDGAGVMSLEGAYAEYKKEERQGRDQQAIDRLIDFVAGNEGCTQDDMVYALETTKPSLRKLLDSAGDRIIRSGKGSKTNPFRYAPYKMEMLQREVTSVQQPARVC
jgi:hypothetical protein